MRLPLLGSGSVRLILFATLTAALAGCLAQSKSKPAAALPSKSDGAAVTSASDPVLIRIREEGLQRSQIPETADYLLNVIGHRLTGSPSLRTAAGWAKDSFDAWGLSNAHLETWGPFGKGWSLTRFSMQVTEPTTIIVNGFPKAWSPGFDQPLEAEVVFIGAKTEAELKPFKGKLAGKIVLLGQPRDVELPTSGPADRLSDVQLKQLAASRPSEPSSRPAAGGEMLVPRSGNGPSTGPSSPAQQLASARLAQRLFTLVAKESPAMILSPSSKGDAGIYFVQGAALPGESTPWPPASTTAPTSRPSVWALDAPPAIPQAVLGIEDFNRLARIAKRGVPIRMNVDLQVKFHTEDPMIPNVIAEIPGSDLADEVVMIGAHLDSWHSGTGATDNGAGSVAVMEAVRIIKALDLKPRRTIRVALWTGEEQGLFGSNAYVKKHFGYLEDPATRPTTTPTTRRSPTTAPKKLIKEPAYEKLSAYFNLDNGSGRIRGVYCQGNDAAAPIFSQWLAAYGDPDARTVTLTNTGGTDHLAFDKVGLPGFQFIQDRLDYNLRTHHSNQDNFDRLQMPELKQASTIMAWFVWKAANEPERFPRKPFDAAPGR